MKKPQPSQSGFTLVELLVAIAVGAIVVMSLTQVVTSYLHLTNRGRYLNISNAYVEAKFEALRNQGHNGLVTGTTDLTSEIPGKLPPSSSASMTISAPAALPGLKQVDISITYHTSGQDNTQSYRTYIGELGVGQ